MKEQEQLCFGSDTFWQKIESSMPGVYVPEKKEIEPYSKVAACVVVCPLYDKGDLMHSKLLKFPAQLKDSRVSVKVEAYLTVIQALNESLKSVGTKLDLNVVFANKGVLLSGEAGSGEQEALDYHFGLYKKKFSDFSDDQGFEISFSDYNNWGVNFPVFINTSQKAPDSGPFPEGIVKPESKMIWQLNKYFPQRSPILDIKKNRHTVGRIMQMNGLTYGGAFWLIAGYLAFDANIAKIVGDNGIYIVAERLEPLFGIAKFTKSLDELARIQIKA